MFLSTVHAAKGMEFDHCLIADGGWQARADQLEAERRTCYVGMTRARHTLALVDAGVGNPHVGLLEGESVLRRTPALDLAAPPAVLARRFDLLGMADLYLDFAGRRAGSDRIHARLAGLRTGDRLGLEACGDGLDLVAADGGAVARLSRQAADAWRPRLGQVEGVRAVAMVRRLAADCHDDFRRRLRAEQWEVPLGEVLWREGPA